MRFSVGCWNTCVELTLKREFSHTHTPTGGYEVPSVAEVLIMPYLLQRDERCVCVCAPPARARLKN